MTTGTAPAAIAVLALRKAFGEKIVLDGVDFTVPPGHIWSLLGPNGAGKTTAVQILSTLIRPDSGSVRVAGHDVLEEADAVRRVIGVTGQFAAVDDMLTGQENLLLMGDLHRLDHPSARRRAAELLARFDLTADEAGRTASTYSGGMRRKLDLAMTLMGDPSIVFLDEPTTGLDPRSRHALWQIVRDLAADGVTMFLTTQYLEEADQLADTVAVLDNGRLVAEGTPQELKRGIPGAHVLLTFDTVAALDDAVRAVGDGATRDHKELSLRVPTDGGARSLRELLDRLDETSVSPAGLSVHTPDLNDVFLTLTGRPQPQRDGASTGLTDTGKPEHEGVDR
ncbi:ATP-binding cassette domain-containing protein [Streptomyces mirabilis]|uniref:ATP-binding cassette domain-containing protein n=1 Tax=Streptomyces mirabilis TaxID=68239 RepID=UPI00365D3C71